MLGTFAAAVSCCFSSPAAQAAAIPAGPEFQVSGPLTVYVTPKVARNASGAAVVIWDDNYHFPPQTYARVYNADGSAKTDPIAVKPFTESLWGAADAPQVAIDDNGDFIIAGTNQSTVNGQAADYIAVQRYDASGTPLGGLIDVAPMQLIGGETDNLRVAMDSDGDFAVAWTNDLKSKIWGFGFGYLRFDLYSEGSNTYARLYDKTGAPKTDALLEEQLPLENVFSVNDYQARYDRLTDLAMNDAGQFALGLTTATTPSSVGATAMIFNADGSPSSGKILLANKAINGTEVGLDAQGNLVATWLTGYLNPSTIKLNSAGYSSAGTALWHHSQSAPSAYDPILKVTPSGEFVVSWIGKLSSGEFQETAQYFNADGSADGAAFSLTEDPTHDMGTLDTAIDNYGNLFATWGRTVGQPGMIGSIAVIGQLFNAP